MCKSLSFILCLMFFSISVVFSAAPTDRNCEIVFVLDASNSMNTTDPDGLAGDCIEQMTYSLPSNYAVGFVAYDSKLQVTQALSDDRRGLQEALRGVNYTGYTNAGAGFEKALQLFSKETAMEKVIVLISDGEINLPDETATKESSDQFNRARQEAANRGIRIYTVAIGDKRSAPPVNIYGADGVQGQEKLYETATTANLSEIAKTIVYEDLGVQKNSVSTGEIQSGSLKVQIPIEHIAYVNRAKVLVTSDRPLENVSASYNAENGEINIGKRFILMDIIRPKLGAAELHLGSSGGSAIRAELIMEMKGVIKAEVTDASAMRDGNEKTAEIRLTPVSADNEELRLLDDGYFENKTVRLTVDGEEMTANVSKGSICFTLPAANTRSVEVKIHFEDLGVNMIAPEKLHIQINKKESYGKYLAMIFVLAVICAFLWWRRHRPAPLPPLPSPSRYDYAGKLNIYVTKAPDDSDIAPMVYNLYRRFSKEEISLGEILSHCGVEQTFEGARRILLNPGTQKGLVITNDSDCTILKNRDLLIKHHSAILYFEEKLHITFEDEKSEVVLHYKNVKPSDK